MRIQLQEFRFRLNPESFMDKKVHILEFPWGLAIWKFQREIKQIGNRDEDEKIYPPYASFNEVICMLSRGLVHGFVWYDEMGYKGFYALSVDPNPPTIAQLTPIFQAWLKIWVEDTYEKEIQTKEGFQLYRELLTSTPQVQNWDTKSFEYLYTHDTPFTAQAIPSILAYEIIGKPMTINKTPIEWCQVVQRNQGLLSLISQPIESDAGGHFAYSAKFDLHKIPGDTTPYIHLSVSCRRYMEEPVESFNFRRNATVYVRSHLPRHENWQKNDTFVPVVMEPLKDKKYGWHNRTSQLLSAVQARPLVDPNEFTKNPWTFRNYKGDEYYLTYSEGMRPDHPLETGFSILEKHAVYEAFSEVTKAFLTPVLPLTRDPETYNIKRSVSMVAPWDFVGDKDKRFHYYVDGKRKTNSYSPDDQSDMRKQAWIRSLGDIPYIVVIYRTDKGLETLTTYLQQYLPYDYPADRLTYLPIPDDYMIPVKDDKEQSELSKKWTAWLEENYTPHPYLTFALIEAPASNLKDKEARVKGAIRMACVQQKIASQLYIQPNVTKVTKKSEAADIGRAKNGITDLLVRQTASVYGNFSDLYQLAGIPSDIAQDLSVIGLTRIRKRKEKLDYCVATRIQADGTVEMMLPHEGNQWFPYHKGALMLGEFFYHNRGNKKALQLHKVKILQFIQGFCGASQPTLLIVTADQLRNDVWEYIGDTSLQFNKLTFRHTTYEPKHFPNLRVVRLRHSGQTNETPQYVGINIDEEDIKQRAQGMYHVESLENPHVYHSIGIMPKTVNRYQKEDLFKDDKKGGQMPFKHQQIWEIIPFFLQQNDKPQPWARLVHRLRYSPSWNNDNTGAPLPNHWGRDAIEDFIPILSKGLN